MPQLLRYHRTVHVDRCWKLLRPQTWVKDIRPPRPTSPVHHRWSYRRRQRQMWCPLAASRREFSVLPATLISWHLWSAPRPGARTAGPWSCAFSCELSAQQMIQVQSLNHSWIIDSAISERVFKCFWFFALSLIAFFSLSLALPFAAAGPAFVCPTAWTPARTRSTRAPTAAPTLAPTSNKVLTNYKQRFVYLIC